MRQFFKKNERVLMFTALLSAMVLLITCTILLLSRYTDELKMLLEFLGNANPRAIVELRRQLAG